MFSCLSPRQRRKMQRAKFNHQLRRFEARPAALDHNALAIVLLALCLGFAIGSVPLWISASTLTRLATFFN